jgi:hypothetical protein
MRTLLLRALPFFLSLTGSLSADEKEDALRTWGGLEKARLTDLSAGKIVSDCNASMKFARGISTKAGYVVMAPIGVTLDVLLNTDPSKDPTREVYQHHFFQAEADAAFGSIKLDGASGPIRKLREATAGSGKGLQLSTAEKGKLPANASADAAEKFWAEVLRTRWKAATASGDLGSTSTYDTRSEIRSLLAEEQKITAHFSALLARLNSASPTPLDVAKHSWFISNINGTGGVQLGGVQTRAVGEQRQVMEVTYYSSFGYLASVSVYELTPILVGDQKATLVWQGSFASAVDLAGNFGLNRKIASSLMLRDVERSIRSFQKSAAAAANAARR